MCVCVCVREREREREIIHLFVVIPIEYKSPFILFLFSNLFQIFVNHSEIVHDCVVQAFQLGKDVYLACFNLLDKNAVFHCKFSGQ